MTGLKHTPGPWSVDTCYVIAPDPTGRHPDLYIAEMATDDEDGRLPPDDEQDANAALLASAPELFHALMELLGDIERPTTPGRREELTRRAREVVSAVLAA